MDFNMRFGKLKISNNGNSEATVKMEDEYYDTAIDMRVDLEELIEFLDMVSNAAKSVLQQRDDDSS